MRIVTGSAVALAIALSVIGPVRADEAAKQVIEKAIKAHGGADVLKRQLDKGIIQKGKIQVSAMGLDIEGTMETTAIGVGKNRRFKQELHLSVMGQELTQTVGFDGKAMWIAVNGMVMMALDKQEDLDLLEEAAFAEEAAGLALLQDKEITIAIIGEDKVGETPVIGVRVSKKGRNDVSLYFEKESGLLKKIKNRQIDLTSRQEVEQERILSDYKEFDGQWRPTKALINQDGKKLLEMQVTDIQIVDKFEESVFAQPKNGE